MDSSSAVSASPPFHTRETQSIDDGDGVFALAKEAAVCFQAHKYYECLQLLKQLLLKKPGDPKVRYCFCV